MSPELAKLRLEIDGLDTRLVALLNERAAVALRIGAAKRGAPIYDPARERAVLQGIAAKNRGPLADNDLLDVYERIIAACRSIQST